MRIPLVTASYCFEYSIDNLKITPTEDSKVKAKPGAF